MTTKLVSITLIKFATLDPDGLGIEMKAGKPGWYDALNGLPGLFGPSVAESFELVRLMQFLIRKFDTYPNKEIKLPLEVYQLLEELEAVVDDYYNYSDDLPNKIENRDFDLWNRVSDIREKYREITKFGFDDTEISIKSKECAKILNKF